MRQKRAKAYKKQMATYERNFGFRHPYQVLYMADFLQAAHGFHLDSVAGVKRTLQNEIKSMITQCCIKELYDEKADPSIRLAKTMERRRCGHVEKAETPHDCVLECVGSRNKNRYVVATQDVSLREKLRRVPGVPLIYINRSVMILEPASPATTMVKDEREKAKIGLSSEEAVILGKRKRGGAQVARKTQEAEPIDSDRIIDSEISVADIASTDAQTRQSEHEAPKRKKRGPPGPNPLSVRKPKSILKKPGGAEGANAPGHSDSVRLLSDGRVAVLEEADEDENKPKRKRKHKKKATSNDVDKA